MDIGRDQNRHADQRNRQSPELSSIPAGSPLGALLTPVTYPVPQSPVFAGTVLKVQGAMLSPGINALNVVTSNGALLTLGKL